MDFNRTVTMHSMADMACVLLARMLLCIAAFYLSFATFLWPHKPACYTYTSNKLGSKKLI